SDQVSIGNNGSLAGIQGTVHVYAPSAIHLIVDDSSDSIGRSATLASNGLTWINYAAPITWDSGTVTTLGVLGGSGGNTFSVQSTPSGMTTDLYGGTGGAAFTLGATGNRLVDLAGSVKVHGQGGTNSLALQDQNRPWIAVYTLTSSNFDDGLGRSINY